MFLDAIYRVVKDNQDYVPPYGKSGSMYIRPFVIGSGPMLGLSAAREYLFIVLVNPVGDYYKGGVSNPVKALIKWGFDRAAPFGSGHVKLGGNYAPTLAPTTEAKKQGYTVLLFLDAKTNKFVEEFATSNFAGLTKPDDSGKRTYVTPRSASVLASVTNRSLLELAALHFGWHVERRQVSWEEIKSGVFDEIAACGTAVVITPVGQIDRQVPLSVPVVEAKKDVRTIWEDNDTVISDFKLDSVVLNSEFNGFKSLFKVYRDIQNGVIPDTFSWMQPVQGL